MSSLLPQQGLLFVLLYAHIIASTFTSTKDLNAGKYVSYKSFFDTCALKLCLSFSGPEWTAKCFAHAATFKYFLSFPCIPFTKARPIKDVKYGSSPYVSWPLPQRGSLKILILGDQKVKPVYSFFMFFWRNILWIALASSEIASPTFLIRIVSNVAAIAIACGNTVALADLATPCNASFHQLYFSIFNLCIGLEECTICDAFSSIVISEINFSAFFSKKLSTSSEGS